MELDKLVEVIFEDRIFQKLLKSYPMGILEWPRRCATKMKENKMSRFTHSLLKEISHVGDFRSYIVKIIVIIIITLSTYYVLGTPKALHGLTLQQLHKVGTFIISTLQMKRHRHEVVKLSLR